MKKKFLFVLIFFSFLVSGCAIDDFFSTPDVQINQTSADKKLAEDKPEKPSYIEPENKSDEPVWKSPEEEIPDDSSVDKEPKSSNESSELDDSKKEDPVSNSPEKNSAGSPETKTTPIGTSAEDDKKPEVPKTPDEGFIETLFNGSNAVLTGIIIALIVMTLILIWLIYDRRKIKIKINNFNNPPHPPQGIATPQHENNVSQISTTIITTPQNQQLDNEPLTIKADNLQHIGARKEQQDSFCLSNIGDKKAVREKGLMAVVADGMGGLEGGALISHIVTDTFLKNYNSQINFDPASFLYNTAENAEFEVEDYMKKTGINGGSTLVAVIIKGSQMNYVSIGDSHIYLLRDNTLTLINKEHNFGALLKEKADRGEIDPREPYINPKRNSLTAYIGMGSFNIVDRNSNPIILKNGDKILLCSDGVYNALGDDALISALAGDASTAAKTIKSNILAQNIPTQDNFTAVILECIKS